jgi:ParB-like chromosome segregation protein Spo0J
MTTEIMTENPLSLHFVPLNKVILHEHTEPRRVERLVNRLVNEAILANPPIVAQANDYYVVLDGATRVTALKQLNFPHIIVQVVSPEDGLGLRTWFHIIRTLPVDELMG